MRGEVRRLWSALAVVVASAIVATMAVLYQGFTTADVDLNDGGVWVTRSTGQSVLAHLNYPSRVLDGSVYIRTSDPELLQDGNDVLLYDPASGVLGRIDPAKVERADRDAALNAGSRVWAQHGVVGLIDSSANGLYVVDVASVTGFSAEGRDPMTTLGAGSVVTVSTAGTVFAASRERGELLAVSGPDAQPTVKRLDAIAADARLAITAVGETAVVFDPVNGVVYTPDRSIAVPEAKGGEVQYPGAAGDKVLISTSAGLVAQPLDGSRATVTAVAGGGTPTRPVWLGGCAYAVWSVSAAYLRDCPDPADDRNEVIQGAGGQPRLVLRQNRGVIVINELVQGLTWLVNDDMFRVDNWDDVLPQDAAGDQEQSSTPKFQNVLPERSEKNTKPVAKKDSFGVRAGSTAVLPVLDNDTDPDGDLLVTSVVGQVPENLTIRPVQSGAALQVTANRNASGLIPFRYKVDDGRTGEAEANVELMVSPAGSNAAPRQDKVHTMTLEAGARARYDATMGWVDPEGDDIYLEGAKSLSGDSISFSNNGLVQFTASKVLGIHEVELVMSDGTATSQGRLKVDVRAEGTLAPVANADRASALTGDRITVAPLANDLSASGTDLRLSKVEAQAGAKAIPDFASGTFSFTAEQSGVYYVQYLVTDDSNSADGIVRVDVQDPNEGLAPLASRDTALLKPSGEALVDVLANDTDPAGGILVVQSVTVPSGSKVSAELLEHRVVRVRDTGGLSAPTTLSYQVSNGAQSATGEIRVLPVGFPGKVRPPTTTADRATVRVGDIVTVDVLANDYHPDGDSLELLPTLVELPDPADGVAFVSEGKVRFSAGDRATSVSFVYQVTDSHDNVSSATVRIQILAADAEANSPPLPRSVTGRTIAGATVRIPIPLDGIDPDGDSVQLVGIDTAPTQGRVSVNDAWLDYEAYPAASGRDTFDYVVRDRLGAPAVGTVVVGIAEPSNANQAPDTARDEVEVRPGRAVSVPVLANDSDPDGDEIALVSNGLDVPDGVTATVDASRVLVRPPATDGDFSISYTAVDDYGAKSQGVLVVGVSAEAPLKTPIARDDRVDPIEIGTEPSVVVAVLENDEDPDGVAEDLTVTSDSPNATVRADRSLNITLTPQAQVVRYTVTDVDAQATSAVVFVPGIDSLLPTLKTTEPATVVAGKQLELPLADYVKVRAGRKPRVAEAESLHVGHADGSKLVADEHTLTYTSQDDYFGPDAVSVRVTDGSGPDDPDGHSAYLSLPILVLPATNQPPTFIDTSVQVAPDEDAVDLNWRKLVGDPDPADVAALTLRVQSQPAGISARVEGDHLLVSAASGATRGSQGEIEVEVKDGGHATTGRVAVTVVTSQRSLPVAVDDEVPQADQGQPVTVDVLRNDLPNPFPDTPLTIVSTQVLGEKGEARIAGDKLVITPAADFVGTMLVDYRVRDATRSPEREAQATVRVTVQGRPDRPDKPMVGPEEDRKVSLSWTAPDPNGRSITGYTVADTAQGYQHSCPTTECTLTNLKNNVRYHFTVVATNAVGDSDPSPESDGARPDAKPDPPAPPALTFGNRQLTVDWTTPHSSGSAVNGFMLELSGDGTVLSDRLSPDSAKEGGRNTYTWPNLKNGTAYRVRVMAFNQAKSPSEWSPYSKEETPATTPSAPQDVAVDLAPDVGSSAQIVVQWKAPNSDGGDPVKYYTVTPSGGNGGSRSQRVENGTKAVFTVGTDLSDYRFDVVAHNKAGDSAAGRSPGIRAANAPGRPEAVSVEATGKAGQLRVTIDPGPANGNRPADIDWKWSGPGGSGSVKVDSESASRVVGTIDGVTNGKKLAVSVLGYSTIAKKSGGSTESNQARAWGPLQGYSPDASVNGDRVRFSWNVADILNGQELKSVKYSAEGGDAGSSDAKSGSASSGAGYYTRRTFTMTVTTAEGNSREYTQAGETGVDPNRSITLIYVRVPDGTNPCDNLNNDCVRKDIRVERLRPNTTYSVEFWTDCGLDNGYPSGVGWDCKERTWWNPISVTTDGNGNGSASGRAYGYGLKTTVFAQIKSGDANGIESNRKHKTVD